MTIRWLAIFYFLTARRPEAKALLAFTPLLSAIRTDPHGGHNSPPQGIALWVLLAWCHP